MTETIEFITAENPEKAEALFRSMSRDELIANCIAAERMIRIQIDRAEYQVRRAAGVMATAKILETDRCLLFGAMERQAKGLKLAATELAGRDRRKERANLYIELSKHANSWMEKPPKPIEWPEADIHLVTLKPEEVS